MLANLGSRLSGGLMVSRAPEADPWSGLSVQSVVFDHVAFRVISWRMGVWKSKGWPSYVHPSNRKPSRWGFFSKGAARTPVCTVD